MSERVMTGHCYCGAVSFETSGKPDWVGHCHCESCRRATGSVMTTFAGFRPEQVVFTGVLPNRYTTDDGVTRSFCGQCGSPVAYELAERSDEIHLHLGMFDDPASLPPEDHSFLDEKVGWLHADEHLPASGYSRDEDPG